MNVFLSGSIRGGRQKLSTYQQVAEIIENLGHEISTHHVADPLVEEKEVGMAESEIFSRDMYLLDRSDCMVAEVSVASTGVGYEVCSALNMGLPVLCIYEEGSTVSAMILGNTNANLHIGIYSDFQELEKIISSFFLSCIGK
ncbi:nucleoside 2-deoxyribosyltransferase [Methanohalophilus levihalophilus]|uniref:nucleoside 2-deoxyribosyltransferase n=1 Tax=Methanohalophilus levihalophilus TaxID=1431282 RepID=UPI001AE5B01D|nr:nucleoside 2-deoxyribosyltransferase [Methanohalophilus levihalophilus]MBP2030599.1 nucleoside 2-deoxyribosyltransferase [Methanohalophilus levihalophilus]